MLLTLFAAGLLWLQGAGVSQPVPTPKLPPMNIAVITRLHLTPEQVQRVEHARQRQFIAAQKANEDWNLFKDMFPSGLPENAPLPVFSSKQKTELLRMLQDYEALRNVTVENGPDLALYYGPPPRAAGEKEFGVSAEDYGDLMESVRRAVNSFVDWNDPAMLRILVMEAGEGMPHDPRLAEKREALLPVLRSMLQEDKVWARETAMAMLGEMIRYLPKKSPLSCSFAAALEDAVFSHTEDAHSNVRAEVQRNMEALHTHRSTAWLSALANNDPSVGRTHNEMNRKRAGEALLRMKEQNIPELDHPACQDAPSASAPAPQHK
jgi:hypothetical protein